MGNELYRVLDYQNGRIISQLNTQGALVALRAVCMYSNSYDVVRHSGENCMLDFIKTVDGWAFEPMPRMHEEN